MSERRPSPSPSDEYFFERSPFNRLWVLFGVGLVVAACDFLTAPLVMFPILFIIPLALMAWNCGLRTTLCFGSILSAARVGFQMAWGVPYDTEFAAINGIGRLSVLLTIIFLVSKLGEQTRALRARVRTLEGILPTCSFCKDIRDPEGNWHQIEEYVTTHSEARFSHGVCPDCASKHYGIVMTSSISSSPPVAQVGSLKGPLP